MSKIEKALNRAHAERGDFPILSSVPGTGGARAGTALVVDRSAQPASAQSIAKMATSESRLLSASDLAQRGLIHQERAADPAVQVFRELRTRIVQRSQGQNGVILVSGASKGSGSSFVAQNLGAAFAFDPGRTALVIDCNLKSPNTQKMMGTPVLGLTDYLENPDLDLAKIIRPVGIARYRVITAGKRRDTPTEFFTSAKMRDLIDSVRQRFKERYIILDGPPMSDIADIRILSDLCDYVLVVARYGRTTGARIEKCLSVVSEKKLLGVVFNDEPSIPWFR
jgi:protein-tyrosine kinase